MKKALMKLIAAVAFVGWSSVAHAGLIWDNGTSTDHVGGFCAACGVIDSETMMDNFSLAAATTSALLVWDASFQNFESTTGAVRISVWSDYNLGLLWSHLYSYSELTLLSTNKVQFYSNKTVSALLSGLNLAQGNYWLSFSGEDMHFNMDSVGNSGQVYSLGTGGTAQNLGELSFRLYSAPTNAVPAPAGIGLLGLALVGLALRRRQQA